MHPNLKNLVNWYKNEDTRMNIVWGRDTLPSTANKCAVSKDRSPAKSTQSQFQALSKPSSPRVTGQIMQSLENSYWEIGPSTSVGVCECEAAGDEPMRA